MHVLVLGAGVAGLTMAHALAVDGHRVTVVDREEGPARGASRANGGQLSYSYVAPLAAPSVLPAIPGWLLRGDSPLRFRPRLDPGQWAWCLRFLAACTSGQSRRATGQLLAMALYSRTLLEALAAGERLAFAHSRTGKLVVYSDRRCLEDGMAQMELQRRLGCEQAALDADGCLEVEPALAAIRHRVIGGIFTPSEQAGDCRLFCEGLEALLRGKPHEVAFVYGRTASRLIGDGSRILAVETDRGVMEADAYVLALGSGSRALARSAGIDLPIYPLKGYSITVPVRDPAAAPAVSITDHARKIVYARLGDRLRIAGMADIVGYAPEIDGRRLALLVRDARAAFPDAADYRHLDPWSGLRPATPTGIPILGPTRYANLLLNVGHGALGFTLAMGTARVVADLLAGRRPAVPLDGFTLPGALESGGGLAAAPGGSARSSNQE